MIFWFVFVAITVLECQWRAQAFSPSTVVSSYVKTYEGLVHESVVHLASVEDIDTPDEEITVSNFDKSEEASLLKRKLYQLAASYDRGFSATPKARKEASDIIDKLSAVNPTENASRGVDGDTSYKSDDVPLKAIWRMIWTSALDVVSLGASPFAGEIAYSFLFPCCRIFFIFMFVHYHIIFIT